MNIDLHYALLVAQSAARDAGALLRENFWKPRTITDKGTNDLVTESDVASEKIVSEQLRKYFPQCKVAGEEGTRIGEGEWTWWIDPLDGTYNFVHGVPRFSVSIALVNGNTANDVQVGVVYDPMFDEMFWAIKGQGAMRKANTRAADPIHVSKATRLRDALVASGFPASLKTTFNNTHEWSAFVPLTQGMARMGSAALDLCSVACGRFDIYWEFGLAPWDMSAGVLIAQEAGGRVTQYDGVPYLLTPPSGLLATNGYLHDDAVRVITDARKKY
jgi:myo-inositol-1(or 4)-monophosphatase